MSDVGRKVVPDKGRLNRERPVTKPLSFHLAQERSPPIRTETERTNGQTRNQHNTTRFISNRTLQSLWERQNYICDLEILNQNMVIITLFFLKGTPNEDTSGLKT